jgi:hypothetical protein
VTVLGVQASFYVEGKERPSLSDLVVVGVGHLCPDAGVLYLLGRAPGNVELVIYLYRWEGVQRVATVAPQVTALGRGHDKHVQSLRSYDRTDGMQTGSSILTDRSQKRQAHAELVEESLALIG